MSEEYKITTGFVQDPPDDRDLRYEDIMGSPEMREPDWDKGHYGHDEDIFHKDQNGSLSCVPQAVSLRARRVLKNIGITSDVLSARDIYSKIYIEGMGGAYIREGMKLVANTGILTEAIAPDYENGNPPSESFMRIDPRTTEELKKLAKSLDKFHYRMIAAGNIETIAHAIENFDGCVTGYTGTNQGWSRPDIRAPRKGEKRWGHAVDDCCYGKLDVPVGDLPVGTKCVFTLNSWGGRYTITEGRWKGHQAIPEAYYLDNGSAMGMDVPGIYTFNAWVFVPDEALPPNQRAMDILKKNQNKAVQVTKINNPNDPAEKELDGAFVGVIVGDFLRTIEIKPKPTEYEKLVLTVIARNPQLGTGISIDDYKLLPKKPL